MLLFSRRKHRFKFQPSPPLGEVGWGLRSSGVGGEAFSPPLGEVGWGLLGTGTEVRLFFFLVINVGAKVRRFYEIYKRLGVLPSTRLKTDMHFMIFWAKSPYSK